MISFAHAVAVHIVTSFSRRVRRFACGVGAVCLAGSASAAELITQARVDIQYWEAYSDAQGAGWLFLPDNDDELFGLSNVFETSVA